MKDLKPLLVKSKEKWTGDDIAEQFNIVKKDTEFKDYVNLMGLMRSKKCNSKYAHLIPPNQRSKSRFLNINILSDWGIKRNLLTTFHILQGIAEIFLVFVVTK